MTVTDILIKELRKIQNEILERAELMENVHTMWKIYDIIEKKIIELKHNQSEKY